jgi:hypothetical protein
MSRTNIDPTQLDAAPVRPCPHCGGGPDTVLVAKKITTYEWHRPDCPLIAATNQPRRQRHR